MRIELNDCGRGMGKIVFSNDEAINRYYIQLEVGGYVYDVPIAELHSAIQAFRILETEPTANPVPEEC